MKHGREVANQLYIRGAGFVLFRLDWLPAQLRLKLWRKSTEQPGDEADLTEVIGVVE